MTLAPHRAVLFTAICLAGSAGSTVARAQEPAPEAPVSAPAPPPEGGVPVAPPPTSPPVTAQPQPLPPPSQPAYPAPMAQPMAQPTTPAGPQPAPGAFDMGGRQVEPLPPPPPAADPTRIKVDSWRGRYWLAPRLLITGPIGGDKPARPTLLTVGGGLDLGFRFSNRLGIGTGLSGQTHTSIRATIPGTVDKTIRNGSALFYDVAFLRLYFLKKRFQPLIEIGGGLARIKMPLGDRLFGAQVRAGVGFDAWISSQVTLGFTGVYRLIALHMPQDGISPPHWAVGHAMQGALQLGLHW